MIEIFGIEMQTSVYVGCAVGCAIGYLNARTSVMDDTDWLFWVSVFCFPILLIWFIYRMTLAMIHCYKLLVAKVQQ